MIEIDCAKCDGRGYFEHQVRVDRFKREKCERCDGSGIIEEEKMDKQKTLEYYIGESQEHRRALDECLDAIVYHRKGSRGASPRVASSWFLNLLKRHGRVKPVEGEDLDAFVRPEVE